MNWSNLALARSGIGMLKGAFSTYASFLLSPVNPSWKKGKPNLHDVSAPLPVASIEMLISWEEFDEGHSTIFGAEAHKDDWEFWQMQAAVGWSRTDTYKCVTK